MSLLPTRRRQPARFPDAGRRNGQIVRLRGAVHDGFGASTTTSSSGTDLTTRAGQPITARAGQPITLRS